MSERKPGWTYGHSELLCQDFAYKINPDGKIVACTADKTLYTQSELDTISVNHGGEYPKQVHMLKHLFGGIIVG